MVNTENQTTSGKQPLVSVGIPTYNRPEGLRRTLECITGQTYRNLEIIISDNCSPDPAVEQVTRSFMAQDARIQYFRQPENKGAAFNFKFVLEQATGEYFMWAAKFSVILLRPTLLGEVIILCTWQWTERPGIMTVCILLNRHPYVGKICEESSRNTAPIWCIGDSASATFYVRR